ncbi:MAG TPA: flavodoxin family protein [Gammaproteobacteria bacterium]|nr:flavodoxin family protein [Gammaproteobacteria bacterium]
MTKLLAINGSYRENGAIDQAVAAAVEAATAAGATVEVVTLRDFPIEFCLNCRHCTQQPGDAPGECVHQDRMHELVARIEAADGFILASPTNFYAVTAIFKRFMERLVVYAWWPWGAHAPKFRKSPLDKKAILIASSAAPGPMGRLFYTTLKQLRQTARTIGAKPVGSAFIGLMSQQEHPVLPDKTRRQVQDLVSKLLH